MSDDMLLRYRGPSVDDGLINATDFVSGLQGLIKLSSIVLPHWHPTSDKGVSLQIKGFNKGSFAAVLVFIETHPVLIGSATAILTATIPSVAYWITKKKKKEMANTEPETEEKRAERKEMEKTENYILGNDALMKKAKEGFHRMAMPLRDEGIVAVDFGIKGKEEEIINQQNKNCFLPDGELESEEIHRTIEMKGALRSLDKKTLNGKFLSEKQEVYPISLRMENPADYFRYFDKDNLIIKGVATYERSSDRLIKIEVEDIVDK